MKRVIGIAQTAVVLAISLGACRSDEPPRTQLRTPVAAPPSGAVAASPVDAPRAVARVVSDSPAIARADAARGTAEGIEDARAKLAAGATGDELWAAAYVYAADGDDPKLLAPLLTHDDATIRVLAGGGLLRLGDRAAFKVLVAETGNSATLRGSEPPQAIGEIAALMLSMVTREQLAVDASAAAKAGWSGWLAANERKLKFDAVKGWSAR